MREVATSTAENETVLKSIAEGKRLDGRGIYDYRRIKLKTGPDYGQAEVQLGKTRVLCQVTCEPVVPPPDQPTEGYVFFNTELSQMASPAFERGRTSDLHVEIGRIIERGFRESRAIETEGLCIVAGKKVWAIRTDLTVLDYCGNAVDCLTVAAAAALRHFRRPEVTAVGEEATIHSLDEREPVPLAIHHNPMTVSFAFFHQGKHMVVDPSLAEERAADGVMTITMNAHKEICGLQKTGRVALDMDQMLRCVQVAQVKAVELLEVVNAHLTENSWQSNAGALPSRTSGRVIGESIMHTASTDRPREADGS